jgi:hypothetical protein
MPPPQKKEQEDVIITIITIERANKDIYAIKNPNAVIKSPLSIKKEDS